MRPTTDYQPLFRRVDDAVEGAVRDTLEEHRGSVPRRTEQYAGSLTSTVSGDEGRIGSPLPQARAMRFGANVGPRRGPHHGPVDTFDDGSTFIDRMNDRLRR